MMYDLMLGLPLFQGLSHNQFTEIIEQVPFHFKKFRPNDYLIHAGDRCDEVMFILSGRVRIVTPVYNNSIYIAEDFQAPHTISFYNLFGREITTRSNVFAQGQVGAMTIDKDNFLKMLESNRLILINALNILSTNAQVQHVAMDSLGETLPQVRLAKWLLAYTSHSACNIFVDADVSDWCSMLNIDFDSFKGALFSLGRLNCIESEGGKVRVIDRYGLGTFVRRKKFLENENQ